MVLIPATTQIRWPALGLAMALTFGGLASAVRGSAIRGAGTESKAVAVSPALPLTVGTAASELMGTKAGGLEQLLAITTAALVH